MPTWFHQVVRQCLALLLLCALAGVGSCDARNAGSGKLMLTYTRWGDPAEMESTRELIAQFQRENPGIEVRVDVVSWEQYWQKMKTATVTNSAQDVWLMSPAYIEEYASAGHVLDLMPFIKADPTFNVDDYFPHAFDDFCFTGEGDNLRSATFGNGKLYAFTRDYNCSLLYYNRDYFDALGLAYPDATWTWDDLVAAARKLTIDFDGDGVIDQWGYGGLDYGAFASAIGAQRMDIAARKSLFSSPDMLRAVTFCQDLIYRYKVHPPPFVQINETESFVTGKLAMTVAGVWNIRSYNRSDYRWGIAPIPTDTRQRTRYAAGGGVAHCISSRCVHPEEAWKLVKFLCGDAGQRALARSGTSVPVVKRIAMSDDFLAGFDRPPRSSIPTIFEVLASPPAPRGYARGYLEYTRRTTEILDLAWRNQITPTEACRRIDEQIDAILADQYRRTAP